MKSHSIEGSKTRQNQILGNVEDKKLQAMVSQFLIFSLVVQIYEFLVFHFHYPLFSSLTTDRLTPVLAFSTEEEIKEIKERKGERDMLMRK